MRILTFIVDGGLRVGAEKDGGVVDLTTRCGLKSVKQTIASGQLVAAEKVVSAAEPDHDLTDIALDLPIPNPTKIYCVGVNYQNRNAEYQDASEAPQYPSLFVRNPLSFAPHGAAILRPPESEKLDYEGEIVVVIGKSGRRIRAEDATAHIAGLTIMNEGTIRDWIRHGKFNVTQGKNWDRSGGLGPWIETDLSGIDLEDMTVETRVNGERRQFDSTASMAFPIGRIIEYVSTFGTLLPGDMIATGTPTGAGARFDPPKWLKPGDVVEVEVEGVGVLSNQIEDEIIGT